jgi:hypothetical protein
VRSALIEAVPRAILAVVIERFEIAAQAFVERIVLARDRVHTIDPDFLEHLGGLTEFLRLGQMTDIAGVNHQRRPLRESIDVRNGTTQATDDVRVGFLMETDVRVTDLDEGEVVFGCRSHRA